MAPHEDFDSTDDVVLIECNEHQKWTWKVHEGLLAATVPSKEWIVLEHGSGSSKKIRLDVPAVGLQHFVDWLYSGSIDGGPRHYGDWDELIEELLVAHATGRRFECTEFMDAVLDEIMKTLIKEEPFEVLGRIVSEYVAEFPAGSGGRQLLIDYIVNGGRGPVDWGYEKAGEGNLRYGNLDAIDDPSFHNALARTIVQSRNQNEPNQPQSLEISKMIISGFFDMKTETSGQRFAGGEWAKNACKYHHHAKLGKPCYKAD